MTDRRTIIAAGFLGLLLLAGGPARAGSPPPLALSYELWRGGFHALNFEARLTRDARAYALALDARSAGLIGWLFPFHLTARAEGLIDGAGFVPRRFDSIDRGTDETLHRTLAYGPDGAVTLATDPPDKAAEEGLPSGLVQGTRDPMSAIFSVVDAVARTGRCEARIPVYDGRRRYDLSASDVGRETLKPSRYALYSGPSTRCHVRIDRVAGFRKGARKSDRFPSEIDVWLAPVAAGHAAMPVRLQARSGLGYTVVHLVGIETQPPLRQARQ